MAESTASQAQTRPHVGHNPHTTGPAGSERPPDASTSRTHPHTTGRFQTSTWGFFSAPGHKVRLVWTDSTGKRSVSAASGTSKPLIHLLQPRPRGLEARSGSPPTSSTIPTPPSRTSDLGAVVMELAGPSTHPPGTGARVSSSKPSGLYFPPAPRGRRHSWCPGRSSQRLLPRPQGEKAGSDASERDGNTSPRPLTGGEVPISTRDAGICTLLPAPQGEKSSPRASPAKVYAAPISAPRPKMPHTSAVCIPIDLDTSTGKTRIEPGHL